MILTRYRLSRVRRHCGGFTLIEVVLALALSVVLLGAIFAALDHAWRLSASGREEMERSQLARALLSQISTDVRSIAFTPPPPVDPEATSTTGSSSSSSSSSSGSSGSSGSSSSSGTSSSTASSTTPPVSLTSIGIRGDAQRIEMHLSRPRRDLDFTPGIDGTKQHTHMSDLVAVQYHLGSGTGMSGLIRTEGDRLTILTNESKGGTADSASKQQLLAPEVISLQFRYFDGIVWSPYWQSGPPSHTDTALTSTSGASTSGTSTGSSSAGSSGSSGGSGSSSGSGSGSSGSSGGTSGTSGTSSTTSGTQMTMANSTTGAGRVPRAIEVTIGLAPPRVRPGPFLRVGFNSSTNIFRSVILIPISDPLPAEFVQ